MPHFESFGQSCFLSDLKLKLQITKYIEMFFFLCFIEWIIDSQTIHTLIIFHAIGHYIFISTFINAFPPKPPFWPPRLSTGPSPFSGAGSWAPFRAWYCGHTTRIKSLVYSVFRGSEKQKFCQMFLNCKVSPTFLTKYLRCNFSNSQ